MIDSEKKIKFYKYFFQGNKKPLIMEAYDKVQANKMILDLAKRSNGKINLKAVDDVRIEVPVKGISTKKTKGIHYTWVGKDKTYDGWMPTEDFKKIG